MPPTRTPILALIAAAACAPAARPASAPAPAPSPAPTSAATTRRLPNEIRWFRNSAEYRALALQTYRTASLRLPELTRGLDAGTWGVILDADETVLDNSEYQRRRALLDSAFTDPTWVAWIRERAADAVPGASAFTRLVRQMGGRVAIVTNRADSLCTDTRENLRVVGVAPDVLLCQPPGQSDKNPRFQRVQQGTAVPGVPPLTVVAWVGDNIQDFPALTQAARDDSATLANFGVRWFVLPNPMYGSWERVPDR
jgi:5'-nucleotidase (lipoprotein e(P4) family)